MQRGVRALVVTVAVGAIAAGVYVIAGLPGLSAPDASGRDVIRTVTGVLSALVAPLALWVAWRSSLISGAALRNQTAPLIVDVPRGGQPDDRPTVVTVGGEDHELAGSKSRVITRVAEGIATSYGLALALRNVGNGMARIDQAYFELLGKRVVGTPDRAVVPKDEAFRLVFEVDDPAAFREVLAAKRIPPIEVTYSDAARQTAGVATVYLRLEGDGPQWDAVVTMVSTSPSRTRGAATVA